MVSINESTDALANLGRRLRAARIAGNQTMAVFAARLGVSVPTLRDMERGTPTVQVGTWINALWALHRLEDLAGVLAQRASLLDRARQAERPQRKRAYAKRRARS
ncbi:MAG: XRE family transcriptional regulator [Betaproteobacteria bacterium]|nr:XRE family transcriptional regulator [Betaproteobacteria bacterium]